MVLKYLNITNVRFFLGKEKPHFLQYLTFFFMFLFLFESNSLAQSNLKSTLYPALTIAPGGKIIYCSGDPVDHVYCESPNNKDFSTVPIGGAYLTGMTPGNAYFDPSVGIGVYTIMYNGKTFTFEVTGPPTLTLKAGVPSSYCYNHSTTALTSMFDVSPVGGTFYIDGIAQVNFAYDGYLTDHTYSITYKGPSCTATTAPVLITVYKYPTINFVALPSICSDQTSVPISTPPNNIWNPTGGTITAAAGVSGNAISGYYFNPSAGTQNLTYSLTVNGCTSTDTRTLTINPRPTVTLSSAKTKFCSTDAIEPINTTITPTGIVGTGVATGDGVLNSPPRFDPSASGIGIHQVIYIFTSDKGCIHSDTIQLQVGTLLYLNNLQASYCKNPTDSFQLTYTPFSSPHILGDSLTGPGIKDKGNGIAWFYPAAAGVAGVKTITHRYTEASTGCFTEVTHSTNTKDIPNTSFTFLTSTPCSNLDSMELIGNFPSGTFTGTAGYYKDVGNGHAWVYPKKMPVNTPQNFTYSYTDAGCTDTSIRPITVLQAPIDFTVSGSGTYCSNTLGRTVTLSGSQPAANTKYQLIRNGSINDGLAVDGTSSIINWNNKTTGNYTVLAIDKTNACTDTMTGTAVISAIPTPALYTVTGGGAYCAGGTGVSVKLSGSTVGTNYQLLLNNSPIDTVAGTGSEIDFGLKTVEGTYKVYATLTTGTETCGLMMSQSAIVKKIALPVAFSMVGLDSAFCEGLPGVYIRLSGSDTAAVTYTLYKDGLSTGITNVSKNAPIGFGYQANPGTYTIIGTNYLGCPTNMNGSRIVTQKPKPLNALSPIGVYEVCQGTTQMYRVPSIPYATEYLWNGYVGAVPGTYPGDNGDMDSILVNYSTSSGGNITVRGRNSCGDGQSASLEIKIKTKPGNLGVITGEDTVCQNETGLDYYIASKTGVTYTWSVPSGATIFGNDTLIKVNYGSSAVSGDISVYANNACGSGPASNYKVTVVPAPVVTLNAPSGIVTCDPTPIDVSVSAPTGMSYLWSTSNGGNFGSSDPTLSSVKAFSAGNYNITVTEPMFSCQTKGTITVGSDFTAPNNGSITTSSPVFISCNNPQVTLTVTSSFPNVSYSWIPSPGLAPISTPLHNNVNITKAGKYDVQIINNATQCSRLVSIVIKDSLTTPIVSAAITSANTKISCKEKTVTLAATSNGVSYQWTGKGNIGTPTSPVTTVDSAGIYTVTVLGANGCSNTAAIQVLPFYDKHKPLIDPPKILTCRQTLDTLTCHPVGGSVLWTGPGIYSIDPTLQNVVVNKPGNYKVVETSFTTGCKDSAYVTIAQDTAKPGVGFIITSGITCSSPSTVIKGDPTSAKNTYQWSTTNGTIVTGSSSKDVTVSAAGLYKLIVTDSTNGCSGFNSVAIGSDKVHPGAIIDSHGSVTCSAPYLSLVAHPGIPVTNPHYDWSSVDGIIYTGTTSASPKVSEGGTYKVVITNIDNGCKDSTTTFVLGDTAKPDIAIVANPSKLTCSTGQVPLFASASNSSYLWTGPAGASFIPNNTSSNPQVDKQGKYFFTATGTNGCKKTDSVNVGTTYTIPTGISIAATATTLTCNTTSITLTGSASPSNSTYSWFSYSGGIPVLLANSDKLTVIDSGYYKLVAYHPLTGCFDSTKVHISKDLSVPTIAFPSVPYPITCDSATSKILTTISPATSTVSWSGAAIFSPSNTDPNPRVNAAGTFTITAKHPVTGCEASKPRTVAENKKKPAFTIALPDTVTCSRTSVLLDATIDPTQVPAVTNYSPVWSSVDGNFLLGVKTNLDVNATEGGTYTLTLKNNDNGCSANVNTTVISDTIKPEVNVEPIPVPATLSCKNTSVKLTGYSISGTQLKWTGPGAITDDATSNPTVTTAGTYTLKATKISSGCSNTGKMTVASNYTPIAKPEILTPEVLTCTRDTINLTVSPVFPDIEYVWTTPGIGIIIDAETYNARVTKTGMYIVTGKSTINGCSNSDTVIVSELKTTPAVSIIGGPYTITCTTTTLQLNGTSATGINPKWSTNGGGHIVSYPAGAAGKFLSYIDAAGDYTLTVEDAATGCTASTSITVEKSVDVPSPNYHKFAKLLTCTNLQDTLFGEPTKASEKFIWISDSSFVSGQNTINPVVNKAATYILKVEDTITHCIGIAAIVVNQDTSKPAINFMTPQLFTCSLIQVELNASSPVTNSSFTWSTTGTGSIKPGDETVHNPIVLTPATYKVTVKNLDNNCTSSKNITVGTNYTQPSVEVFDSPEKITCKSPNIKLQASSNPSTDITYFWSGPGNVYNNGTNNPAVDAPGKYILSVTNTLNGCIGKDSVIVQIDTTTPSIWVNTHPSIIDCAKDTVHLNGNSPDDVTYLWTGGAFNNNTLKEPYVSAFGTYTLKITSNINGCSNLANVTVVENKIKPAAPFSAGGYICYGSNADTIKAVGTGIKWYSSAALGTADFIKSDSWLVPSSASAIGEYNFFITQTDPVNHCESPAFNVVYYVKDLPVTPITYDSSICYGLPNPLLRASGTFAGAVINWYNSISGASLGTGNNYVPPASFSTATTHTFYATQTDAYGCESSRKLVYLTIHSLPNKPTLIQPSASICFGAANIALNVTGTNIKWYDDPMLPAAIASGNTYIPIVKDVKAYKYYVTQTNSFGCEGDADTLTYVIKNLPYKQLVTSTGDVYCEGQTGINVGLSSSGLATSYSLLRNGTSIVKTLTGTGGAIDFGKQTAGNYTVVADSNSCSTTMTGGVTISVNPLPLPAGIISGISSVCEGTTNVTYSVPSIPNATSYIWTIPAGSTISSGLNSNIITLDFNVGANTGNVNVYATNGCGSGLISQNKQVVVNKLPATAGNIKLIGKNNFICLGDSDVSYEIDPVAYATSYEWVVPANAEITYGEGSRSIRVKYSASVSTGMHNIKVRGINSCGSGEYSNLYSVSVSSNPSVFAGDEQNLCAAIATLNGSVVPAGGSGMWKVISGYAIIADSSIRNTTLSNISQGENLISWTVKNSNGCSSTSTVKILNNKVPVEAGINQSFCSETIQLEASEVPAGATGLWSVETGSHASIDNTLASHTQAADFAYGVNKLYWSILKNGCSSVDSLYITGNRPSQPQVRYKDYTTCTNSATLIGNNPVNGKGTWELISGAGQIEDSSATITQVTSLGKGKNVFYWRISGEDKSCNLIDSVIIQNHTILSDAGYDKEVCDNKYLLQASPLSEGESGYWHVFEVNNIGAGNFSPDNSNISEVSNMDLGSNHYVWTVWSKDCSPKSDTVVIKSLLSVAEAGDDIVIGGSTAVLAARPLIAGTGKWNYVKGYATFDNDTLYNTIVNNLKPGVNKLIWSVTNQGLNLVCPSLDSVNVVNATLEDVFAGKDTTICSGASYQLNASKPVYGSGKWNKLKGGCRNWEVLDKSQYNATLLGLYPDSTILTWTVSLTRDLYSTDTVIIVNNSPTIARVEKSEISVCFDEATIKGNIPTSGTGTGKWEKIYGSGIIENPDNYETRVTSLDWGNNNRYKWTITKGNCLSSAELNISNYRATVANADLENPTKQIITCDDYLYLHNNSPIPGAEQGQWQNLGGYGTFDNTNSYVSALGHGSNKFTWVISSIYNLNCKTSDNIEIISYKPTTPKVFSKTVVCEDSVLLNANKGRPDEITFWEIKNGGGVFDNSNSNLTYVKRIASSNIYSWTIQSVDNPSCKASAELPVYNAFIKADAGDKKLIESCFDSVQLIANNVAGIWSPKQGSASFPYGNTSPYCTVKDLAKGTNILKWTVKSTVLNTTCLSYDTIVIINNSPSEAYAGAAQDICGNVTTLLAKKPIIGQGVWTKTSGAGVFKDSTAYNTRVSNVGYGINVYKWTVSNNGLCPSESEVVIKNIKPYGTFATSEKTTLCADSVKLSGNTPPTRGTWNFFYGGGIFDNPQSPTTVVRGLAPDTNVIRWIVWDRYCPDTAEIIVVNNQPTTALAGANRILCSDKYQLDGNIPVQGKGKWIAISTTATITNESLYNSMVTGLAKGKNILRWTIAKNGCNDSYSEVTITNDLPDKADAGTDQELCDSTTTLNAVKPAVGTGYWRVANGYAEFDDSSQNNTIARYLGQGTNVLTWVTQHNKCILSDTVSITSKLTNVYAGPDQVVFDDSTMLVANPPSRGTGTWYREGGNVEVFTPNKYETLVRGLDEGLNTFKWSVNVDGCISSDKVVVRFYKLPTASFSVNKNEGCIPLEVKFTNTTIGNNKFAWSFGEKDSASTQKNPIYTYNVPGMYKAILTVYGMDNIPVTKEQYIYAYKRPQIKFDLVPDSIYLPKDVLRCYNYSEGGASYLWSFGDGTYSEEFNPAHAYKDSGFYRISLVVTTANNCSDSVVMNNGVHVIQRSKITFPNSFTPSVTGSKGGRYNENDYNNDVFYPIVLMGDITEYKLQIYNRWGILMFESRDISIGWDGYYKQKLATEDVYIYRVTGRYNSGEHFDITGDFLLIRRQ